MKIRDTDDRTELVAGVVALTEQAALLRARVDLLREELATVSARMSVVSHSLQALYHPALHSAAPVDAGRRGSHERRGIVEGPGPAAARRAPRRHPH
ncbi:hypothetical protein ACWD04_31650 [Streptomyces sp. NPDC002911]